MRKTGVRASRAPSWAESPALTESRLRIELSLNLNSPTLMKNIHLLPALLALFLCALLAPARAAEAEAKADFKADLAKIQGAHGGSGDAQRTRLRRPRRFTCCEGRHVRAR